MDSHRSKLNGTVFGMNDWPDCVRGQAALYRNLAEQTDDPVVKHELLALARSFVMRSPITSKII